MATAEPQKRYIAFLSYSHLDRADARWLHRRLEGYRLPRSLIGKPGAHGPVPASLKPIFRDREDLPATNDLSDAVTTALRESANLIVLCSPHAKSSAWVAQEIAAFRAANPTGHIFAAVIAGEPSECFPAGIADEHEPLAADLRDHGDGRSLGVLKLVAGLAGVRLDALVQRDAQRHLRRMMAAMAGAVLALAAMAVLTLFAFSERADARRQRGEAEGMVEFMLTDLRDRLQAVGRLDVLTAVNRQALEYYARQGLEGLGADSLERRARVLHAMGADDIKRGKYDEALAQFREAARTTKALLDAAPDDPDRIFAQSQSEFWVGLVDYQRGNYAAAKPAFERYKAMADRLIAMNPGKVEWLKESAYAEGNLCSIALAKPVDPPAALRTCGAALARMQAVWRNSEGKDSALMLDLANRYAWAADALRVSEDLPAAMTLKREQIGLARVLIAREPANRDYRDFWTRTEMTHGELLAATGDPAAALRELDAAGRDATALRAIDPANREWATLAAKIAALKSSIRGGANGGLTR